MPDNAGNRFAAERISWPQSRVSRLETGSQLPTEDDVRTWVAAAGAPSEAVAELLERGAESACPSLTDDPQVIERYRGERDLAVAWSVPLLKYTATLDV